jgi:hypothetical protein
MGFTRSNRLRLSGVRDALRPASESQADGLGRWFGTGIHHQKPGQADLIIA